MTTETQNGNGAFVIRGARDSVEERAVAAAVAIPALVVQSKGHGHAGTAMAMAPTAHVLFQRVMQHDPSDPRWEGRDRFVLSTGHASLLLYTQLYLTGYGLELSDLAKSRSLDSRTPGHPELGVTAGVEMSTGPLGQGVASAVGIALAARRDEALHGRGSGVWDPTVFVLAGDGCLQEGVSGEAASLAGTLGLDNLVLMWDDNRITIDGPTELAFSEDVRARYRSYGWNVIEVDEYTDLEALESALLEAKKRDGKPTMIAIRSVIAGPAPTRSGTPAAHAGALGESEVGDVLDVLGFSREAKLGDVISDEVLSYCRRRLTLGAGEHAEWNRRKVEWESGNPEVAAERYRLTDCRAAHDSLFSSRVRSEELRSVVDGVSVPDAGELQATRKTNGTILSALVDTGHFWGGSADLSGSTNVAVPGAAVTAQNPGGDFIAFGVREHAMIAILSGIALHGLWRPYGSTYLAFSDYQRPSIRLAALMGLPLVLIYTHDSVAVGEDGPTHQPVEQIASLRTVPGLSVVRPADAAEVVAAWRRIVADPHEPTALILSRQDLPVLDERPDITTGVGNGGYVAWRSGVGTDLVLIASGSEVSLAIEAAKSLAFKGVNARVVSMPCVEWFKEAPREWQDEVLPPEVRARVAIEAGIGDGWYRWVGLDGEVVSIEEFGESGSGAQVMERKGMSVERVIAAARRTLSSEQVR